MEIDKAIKAGKLKLREEEMNKFKYAMKEYLKY